MPVLAHHVVLSTYGSWLPNDPRGSNSMEVRADNIKPFGPATLVTHTRRSVANQPHDQAMLGGPRSTPSPGHRHLRWSPSSEVANGFATQIAKSGYHVYACCILSWHIHMVIGRHDYPIEQMVRLLKQAATARLLADGRHRSPAARMGGCRRSGDRTFARCFCLSPMTCDEASNTTRIIPRRKASAASIGPS